MVPYFWIASFKMVAYGVTVSFFFLHRMYLSELAGLELTGLNIAIRSKHKDKTKITWAEKSVTVSKHFRTKLPPVLVHRTPIRA